MTNGTEAKKDELQVEKEKLEEDETREYLAGNLCRCSGYEGQLRGILAFLDWKREKQKEAAE